LCSARFQQFRHVMNEIPIPTHSIDDTRQMPIARGFGSIGKSASHATTFQWATPSICPCLQPPPSDGTRNPPLWAWGDFACARADRGPGAQRDRSVMCYRNPEQK
jgi:hypothetical protein